jgi:hypothetical protein
VPDTAPQAVRQRITQRHGEALAAQREGHEPLPRLVIEMTAINASTLPAHAAHALAKGSGELVLEDDVLVLYRCGAEGAACFCSQSAQLANAQAADVTWDISFGMELFQFEGGSKGGYAFRVTNEGPQKRLKTAELRPHCACYRLRKFSLIER